MVTIHNLGFPKIGNNRQWKKVIESYWSKKIDLKELNRKSDQIQMSNWKTQIELGTNLVTVGDYNFYDHILNASLTLGVVGERFKKFYPENITIDTMFLMARGKCNDNFSTQACEMTKWFDTNYHYIVPELGKNQKFSLQYDEIFRQTKLAKKEKYDVKPVFIGPLSFLWLCKNYNHNQEKLSFLPNLLKAYKQLIKKFEELEIKYIQFDEPILGLNLPENWQEAYIESYKQLNISDIKIIIATYFGDITKNLELITNLDVSGIHIDCSYNNKILNITNNKLDLSKILSVGIVDGRNIWRNDLNNSLNILNKVHQTRKDKLWLAPSCSLLHCPVDLDLEVDMDPEIKSWLAFSKQKLNELKILKMGLNDETGVFQELTENKNIFTSRKNSTKLNNQVVQKNVKVAKNEEYNRDVAFEDRKKIQQKELNLPIFPTTTIGSFPQTDQIRSARAKYKKKLITFKEYEQLMEKEIKYVIDKQNEIGLDVLVHGEAERNDMVEYFGEQLNGYIFSKKGWVVSYGSRCVKPPIIYGDISRSNPITLKWSLYSASQTNKIVKGMLTGPVTMLKWSFVRDDIPLEDISYQISLALREEVLDLEKNGFKIIQIDEPALREGLPLVDSKQEEYLNWAVKSFKICTSKVKNTTQIHTHMCYCEFNEILNAIAKMDADVISIEASRSNFEILEGLADYHYPNDIGPGVYDIHSPNVPSIEEMVELLNKALKLIPIERLWVNPDCGLKTRKWAETESALTNMVKAAKQLRRKYLI